MHKHFSAILAILSMFLLSTLTYAEDISKEQIKGLDEQVQEIKTDVLNIAAELNQLEEKLLYPSHTQVAVFISLNPGETFRLDSVEIQIEGKPVAEHLYTFKELDALKRGGVQQIYTGNVLSGDHAMQVSFLGKTEGGNDLQRTENYTLHKGVGPQIVEVALSSQSITFKDR